MKILLTLLLFIIPFCSFSQLIDTDGKSYKFINIGNQVWLTENLQKSNYRNGEPILEAKSIEEWISLCNEKKGAWCYYDFLKSNSNCGKLYNWYVVHDNRGLAPNGWHIPDSSERKNLISNLGGAKLASTKLKEKFGWQFNGNGSNESGFSALPCGALMISSFLNIGLAGYWLSSSGGGFYNESTNMTHDQDISLGTNFNKCGFAIRYVKDSTNNNSFMGIDLNQNWYTLTNYQQLSYFLVDSDTANHDPLVITDFEYSHDKISKSFLDIGYDELLLGFPRGMQTKLRDLQPELFLARKSYKVMENYLLTFEKDISKTKYLLNQQFGNPELNMVREKYSVYKWKGVNYQIILTSREDELSTTLIYTKE